MLLGSQMRATGRSAARPAPATSHTPRSSASRLRTRAQKTEEPAIKEPKGIVKVVGDLTGLGDALGPIGMTIGTSARERPVEAKKQPKADGGLADSVGVSLGPISLSFGDDMGRDAMSSSSSSSSGEASSSAPAKSIHSMTTEEWRAKYEKDGAVDLWVEEEFNAGSRLVGGRAVHKGGVAGFQSGEGPSAGTAPLRKVKIIDHYGNQELEIEVPEDRYVIWEAEDRGLQLPYACRMGCCTACAVRVLEGEMYQPEALGISQELREQGYGLMCVGYPSTDLVIETVSEDEIYDLQFGRYFAEQALDPNNKDTIERDDFALEFANMDE